MSEITDNIDEEYVPADELASLKAKADVMGIKYHPSIGLANMRIKVSNALAENPVPEEELELEEEEDSAEPTPEELEEEAPVVSSIPKPSEQVAAAVATAAVIEAPVVAPVAAPVVPEVKEADAVGEQTVVVVKPLSVAEKRDAARKEAMKLVRVNVTCMNPLKKEWAGEIITVGNNLVGTVSKYVPFDTVDGWHIPNIIYLMLKDRQFQMFSANKKAKAGQASAPITKLVREFAIEVLDPLSPTELAQLKQRQLIAKNSQE